MKKVLIIDDEKATLTMFGLFMKTYGYDVLVAEDGRTGIDMFADHRPPIVFTDLKMPVVDGFDVIKSIHDIAPETEIIVITGHGDMDLVVRALNLNVTDFINKPVSRQALDEALKRAEHRIATPASRSGRVRLNMSEQVAVIGLEGTLDGNVRQPLSDIRSDVSDRDCRGIVFRFAPDLVINGEGMNLFIRLLGDIKKAGLPVAVCGLSRNLETIFGMVGITRSVPAFADCDAALAEVTAAAD